MVANLTKDLYHFHFYSLSLFHFCTHFTAYMLVGL